MLRIHFEGVDLARTTVASSADVLWEILLSLHTLQEPGDEPPFEEWRRAVGGRVSEALQPLFELAPPRGYSVDFITPTRGVDDLSVAIDVVLSTSPDQVMEDLAGLAGARSPFYATHARGDATAVLRQVVSALTEYFDAAIAPYWKQISHDIDADRARRVNELGKDGVERLLEGLHPFARWKHPVLEVDDHVDQDLHLDGRGLVLAPSFFCRRHPMTLRDPGGIPS